jgi:hypothetical protein
MRLPVRWAVPPQHGAWAYLAVPLILGLQLSGATAIGLLFAATWIAAYPAAYYLSRATAVRLRRGTWTRLARREAAAAVPWTVAAGAGGVGLVVLRPWLLAVGAVLAAGWSVGLWLALRGRERGFGNDLLLVGEALLGLPLMWMITVDSPALTAIPGEVWFAAFVSGVSFVGSVIHVKSLIREADDRRWRWADIGFHALALALAALSWWLFIPFAAALLRSLVLRPGARPAVIGAVEIGVCVLVVVCVGLSVGPTPL